MNLMISEGKMKVKFDKKTVELLCSSEFQAILDDAIKRYVKPTLGASAELQRYGIYPGRDEKEPVQEGG